MNFLGGEYRYDLLFSDKKDPNLMAFQIFILANTDILM